MASNKRRVDLDGDSFRAAFLANLQLMQDHLRACEGGLDCLTPAAFADRFLREGPVIYADTQRGWEGARDFSRFWLARSFFRDVIDFVGDYLDHAFELCNYLASAKSGRPDWVTSHAKRLAEFQRRGMPDKFASLSKTFGISTDLNPYVLSINAVRNCIVHGLGKVRPQDCRNRDGVLELRLRGLVTSFPGKGSGKWVRVALNKQDMVYEDAVTTFKQGDHLRFDLPQMNACLYTLLLFEDSMRESLATHFVKAGVNVTRQDGDPKMKK
jgi:hypothetical protein